MPNGDAQHAQLNRLPQSRNHDLRTPAGVLQSGANRDRTGDLLLANQLIGTGRHEQDWVHE
jgi:hypothetical protein